MPSNQDPSAPSEDETEYDGFLSYAAEWHAFTHGVYKGVTTMPYRAPPEPDNPDVNKEPHYYRGGYVLGTLLQLGIIVFFGVEAAAL